MLIDEEIHLTKKDFKLEWFSGSGAGGQHRNKHQNCCRITHLASGIRTQGTEAKDRPTNQRVAFTKLAKILISKYYAPNPIIRFKTRDVIRNYNEPRNEVLDKASSIKGSYKNVIDGKGLEELIDARRTAIAGELREYYEEA